MNYSSFIALVALAISTNAVVVSKPQPARAKAARVVRVKKAARVQACVNCKACKRCRRK